MKTKKKMTVELPKCVALFAAEDIDHAQRLAHCDDLFGIVWEFLNHDLRVKLHFGHDFKTPDEALEWVRDSLREDLQHQGINVEAMWR